MNKKIIIILLISFIILNSLNAYANKFSIIPKTILILPENCATKIRWILVPEQNNKPVVSNNNINFFIDFKNEPIILYDNRILFNPISGNMVILKKSIKDVISLDNGVLLFSGNNHIGYLEIDEIEKKNYTIPHASLKPLIKLPMEDSKIFRGDNTFYALGFNPKTSKYQVYFFNNFTKKFNKIASFNEPISAISGKGEHFYLAQGKLIKEYKKGKLSLIYEHPREEIRELFYNEKAGLIYKTSNGVGLVKNNSAFEFLQTENPQIFLKETSIYVFFSSISGILKIENIDDLNNYNFKVIKIIDIQQTF